MLFWYIANIHLVIAPVQACVMKQWLTSSRKDECMWKWKRIKCMGCKFHLMPVHWPTIYLYGSKSIM